MRNTSMKSLHWMTVRFVNTNNHSFLNQLQNTLSCEKKNVEIHLNGDATMRVFKHYLFTVHVSGVGAFRGKPEVYTSSLPSSLESLFQGSLFMLTSKPEITSGLPCPPTTLVLGIWTLVVFSMWQVIHPMSHLLRDGEGRDRDR